MYHVTITTRSGKSYPIEMTDDALEDALIFMTGESLGTLDCQTSEGNFVAFAPGSVETLTYDTETVAQQN